VGESSVVELPNFPPPAPPLPAASWALGGFRSEQKKIRQIKSILYYKALLNFVYRIEE
jgi:hypothetical protein